MPAGSSSCGPSAPRALGARDDVAYVLVFENRGPEVGATIAHPHGQIYAYDEVPPEPLRELVDGVLDVPSASDRSFVVARRRLDRMGARRRRPGPTSCCVATAVGQRRADRRRVRPRRPGRRCSIDVLARLDQLVSAPMPYMMWIHQRPTDGERAGPTADCTSTSARCCAHPARHGSWPPPSSAAATSQPDRSGGRRGGRDLPGASLPPAHHERAA